MFRTRCTFYTCILAIATFMVSHGMLGWLVQWSSPSSNKIERHLIDAGINNPNVNLSSMSLNQVDLLVEVFGQLGNHLHLIGMGSILKFFAKNLDPPVEVKLHYSSLSTKQQLVTTRNDINTCFTNFEDVDFYEVNESSKQKIRKNQYKYRKHCVVSSAELLDKRGNVTDVLNQKIKFIVNKEFLSFGSVESIPYLFSRSFSVPALIDQYYGDLIELLDFNDEHCCNEVPDPDETVVHIRGFSSESRNEAGLLKTGRKELDPQQLANDVLGHLTKGDKVAIVAPSFKIALPYKTVLETKGMKVRSLSQTRVQDFCFLMKATREIVAHHLSTFSFWAAILSTSVKKVTLYRLKSQTVFIGDDGLFDHHYDWKHPELKDLFQYPEIEYNPI